MSLTNISTAPRGADTFQSFELLCGIVALLLEIIYHNDGTSHGHNDFLTPSDQ